MKVFASLSLLLFTLALQGTITEGFNIKGIKPDFLLIVSYGIGLYKGEVKGLILGGFIGLLADASTSYLLGPNLLSKATVGFLSGFLRKKVFMITVGVNLIFILALSMLDGGINYLIITIFLQTSSCWDVFQAIILPQALYSSIVGTALLTVAERVYRC